MGLLHLDHADLVLPNAGAELMGRATSDPGIDWVRGMLEEKLKRKRRLFGLFGGRVH